MNRLKEFYKKNVTIILSIVAFAGGVCFGMYYISSHKTVTTSVIRENLSGYRFINPILYVSDGSTKSPNLQFLQNKLNSVIEQYKSKNEAIDASVYIKDFTNEYWTGVNENVPYTPSSMLKVAIMIAYLKIAETDPSIMLQKEFYQASDDSGQYFKPGQYLGTGMHTNEELISSMIKESDNTAEKILSDNILNSSQHNMFAQIFVDLHMPLPTPGGNTDFLSVKQYSRLFRVLYNGSYLPNAFSENALDLLSNTTFKSGLVSGVGSDSIVAHKFGEHSVIGDDGSVEERQLHDCGIIYKPNHPYLLCIMTRSKDFNNLEAIISDISSTVYNNIDNVKTN